MILVEDKEMSEIVTLELSEEVARSAREVATRMHRRLEDVLVEWIDSHQWTEAESLKGLEILLHLIHSLVWLMLKMDTELTH